MKTAARGGTPRMKGALSRGARGGTPRMRTAARGGTPRMKGAFSRGARGGTPRMKMEARGGTPRMKMEARGGTPRMRTAARGGTPRVEQEEKSARCGVQASALIWACNRDLCRAALFLCRIPLPTNLSRTGTAAANAAVGRFLCRPPPLRPGPVSGKCGTSSAGLRCESGATPLGACAFWLVDCWPK